MRLSMFRSRLGDLTHLTSALAFQLPGCYAIVRISTVPLELWVGFGCPSSSPSTAPLQSPHSVSANSPQHPLYLPPTPHPPKPLPASALYNMHRCSSMYVHPSIKIKSGLSVIRHVLSMVHAPHDARLQVLDTVVSSRNSVRHGRRVVFLPSATRPSTTTLLNSPSRAST